jgi:hypothetical protein
MNNQDNQNKKTVLEELHARIKYSRLYRSEHVERLYLHYGANDRNVQTLAWIEMVNGRPCVFVRVHRLKPSDYYDSQTARQYKKEIEKQFRELLDGNERGPENVVVSKKLRDDIIPVYSADSMKHQIDALRFCCSMKVSALYADTSTGKSKVAIDLAISRFEAKRIKKVLVFLPVSTKVNFKQQIDTWCTCPDIIWKLIGHETISNSDNTFMEALHFVDSKTMIIIDESHAIKTPTAKRSIRIGLVCEKAIYKLVMTGTPVTEHVHDLYMQYQVLSPNIIGMRDWKMFSESYLLMGGRIGNEILGFKNLEHLTSLVDPYTYQITKEECLSLPAKHYHVYYSELNEQQKALYEREKRLLLKVIENGYFRVTDIFISFVRMQQICSGYSDFNMACPSIIDTNKLALFSLLPQDEKLVIFCKFLFEINSVVTHFKKENCVVFSGKNPKTRDAELRDFVKGKKKYFVATMQSGGTGLNGLQEVCRHMVFYSNSFSYYNRKQSIGRLDRVGQLSEMHVHDFYTTAKIDDKIMQNLLRKRNLVDEIKDLMADKTRLKRDIENL